ncbi:MAG: heavy metal translocating P-type ATPase [Clostridia bacterium]|nr:heavy metal translocating P-type ATPase [Clostridia bacterium]
MRKYKVTGMSCAACSARVQKAVSELDGVTKCEVNLLTADMTVEGDVTDGAVAAAVKKAGYGAYPADKDSAPPGKQAEDEAKKLLVRFIVSLVILIPLMYVSMGAMIGLPTPPFFADHRVSGVIQLVLSLSVMVINRKFFINGAKGLIRLAPNMDTLVMLGSFASFAYSVWMLVKIFSGDHGEHGFYFEGAAMILTLITLGKMLEAYSKGKTTNALKALTELAPDTANVIRDGTETVIAAKDLTVGDIFAVYPGERFASDGVVIEGACTVDESSLTGESVPVDKKEGDGVSAATVNKSGYVKCRATAVGEDTALSKIIRAVSDAASSKAPVAKAADKVAAVFVPCVMAVALITFVIWMLTGQTVGYALSRAVSVLVISCPCALGLATPVAVMVGSGVGAKHNILFKTAASLEETGKVKTVVFDKTGTLTEGRPKVTDVIPVNAGREELLLLAASVESKSEHPFASAIIEYSKGENIIIKESENFVNVPGKGLRADIGGEEIYGGNAGYIKTVCDVSIVSDTAKKLSDEGKTPLYFAKNGTLLGVIAVSDVPREDAKKAVSELRKLGVDVVMLTGDNERTAAAIGAVLGIGKITAGVLPDQKEEKVKELCKENKTAMVGDGINDAPALTSADVGIAIGAGTDIAMDSADVVLMKSSPEDVATAIRLSKKTLKTIYENLMWAFLYNVICIPIAAGAFAFAGITLNPMIASAAMSISSFCVVMNALRLNLFKADNNKKEINEMKKVLKIKGMMCPHCEARVRSALEAVEGVKTVAVSHKKGIAEVTSDTDIADEKLVSAVTGAGYTVLGIK